jgi:hypothetical protein
MTSAPAAVDDTLVRRHLAFGWWALLFFVILGLLLEALHGFKVDWYLGRAFETRRLLWRLAHAHGTLLAVLNLVFAFSASRLRGASLPRASRCLQVAAVALPLGFFGGGLAVDGGDPHPLIALVPLGALFLVAGVFLTARATLEKAQSV